MAKQANTPMKRTNRTYSLDNRPPSPKRRFSAVRRKQHIRASTAAKWMLKGHINAHLERERLEAVRLHLCPDCAAKQPKQKKR